MPLEAGRRLGLFEVISPLGAGGMGEVYKARDARLGRHVALKVLPEAFASRSDRQARFEREARALASLQHPGIAAIHGFEESGGVTFLVLELVLGETLAQRLDRGALPVRDSLEVAKQIAAALEAAHEKGIIHRDLKPSNVMRMPDGRVKLLDFGLAKVWEDDPGRATSQAPTASDPPTRGGTVLGTAPYMSPEQARGEAVDKRTDVWAFGCVLYEMLSGRRAFGGATTADVMAALLEAEPDWDALPPRVPPSIRTLLRRCLTRDLSRRTHDIGDARIEIVEALEGGPLPAPGMARGGARSRRLLTAGFLLLLFLAGGLAYRLLEVTGDGRSVGGRFVIPTSAGARFNESSVPFAVSPDGRRLLYATADALFLRSLDEAEARPLPGGGGFDPFFSPDGEWVAFWAAHSLQKAPIRGGAAPSVLCEAEDLVGGVWSSDGTIIFAPGDRGPLVLVPASGGRPQPVTRLEAGEIGHLWPDLLPGGKVLLFAARTGPGAEDFRTVAQSLESGDRKVLVEGGARARYAPTGHLVYARGETLFAARFDLAKLRLEGPAVPVIDGVATGPNANAQFAFSPEGSLFYVAAAGPARRSLVLVDRRGFASPLPVEPRPYVSPRVSPDGRRLAVQVGDYPRSNVWIYDLETGTFKRLTSGELDTFPCWTPDGKRVTFASGAGSRRRITWQAADGSEAPEALTEVEAAVYQPSWSPDGRTLLFTETGLLFARIRALRRGAASDPEILVSGPVFGGRVSPDGRWLTYMSKQSGQDEIYLRSFDRPGPSRQLTTDGGVSAEWSRDGRELFYMRGGSMMALPMDTARGLGIGPPQALFEDRDARASGFLDFDSLPDGRFVMVRAGPEDTAPGAIHVVTGWFDQLRRAVPK